jgi:hypothetical protein
MKASHWFIFAVTAIVSYNWFLIQRDHQLFEAYNQPNQQVISK